MLVRVESLQGIGLFHEALSIASHKFEEVTLIYGDNGRGKSTFAHILSSLGSGRSQPITDRKTLGGTKDQRAIIQFDGGDRLTFSSSDGWSTVRPEILVFDSAFVDSNVFSGPAIGTDHRKRLLEFALGEDALSAKQKLDDVTTIADAATADVRAAKLALAGHHAGINLQTFVGLTRVTDIDDKMRQATQAKHLAQRTAALTQRPQPGEIPVPDFDLEPIIETLAKSIDGVHHAAANSVQAHVGKLGDEAAKEWLHRGLTYAEQSDCPFCGQDISANSLIAAYRQLFDDAYNDLEASVAGLRPAVEKIAGTARAEALRRDIASQIAIEAPWIEEIDLGPTAHDAAMLETLFSDIRSSLSTIIQAKLDNPNERIERTELNEAQAISLRIVREISSLNASLRQRSEAASELVAGLATSDADELGREIELLERTKLRHSETVVSLVDDLNRSNLTKKEADDAKILARSTLDKSMATTLEAYSGKINGWLNQFGAPFVVGQMTNDYLGGSPKAKYHLKLRGATVPLAGGPPSFSTTLSDGDKRTLAFSFFLARTFDDVDLSSKIIVIDDPMTSLDANRTRATLDTLRKLADKANQLIVLAHDFRFLRGLEESCKRGATTPSVKTLEVCRTNNDFSEFKALDLEQLCESPYLSNHRVVTAYAESGVGDQRAVAASIRPMIEGYLHRRFPGHLPQGAMLGQAISALSDAATGSVLAMATSQVDELRALSRYASQFHHDTNSDYLTANIISTELTGFCGRALRVVHGWS